jgi:hypothetical protein
MQNHATAEVASATTLIALGFAKFMEVLIKAEPLLASISYIVAIIAGLMTIYFKCKKKG